MSNRENLSPVQFYEKFFIKSDISKENVVEILHFIKENLDIPIKSTTI